MAMMKIQLNNKSVKIIKILLLVTVFAVGAWYLFSFRPKADEIINSTDDTLTPASFTATVSRYDSYGNMAVVLTWKMPTSENTDYEAGYKILKNGEEFIYLNPAEVGLDNSSNEGMAIDTDVSRGSGTGTVYEYQIIVFDRLGKESQPLKVKTKIQDGLTTTAVPNL